MARKHPIKRALISRVKRIRTSAGISQQELGRRLGVSRGTIKRLEGGELKELDEAKLDKLLRLLEHLEAVSALGGKSSSKTKTKKKPGQKLEKKPAKKTTKAPKKSGNAKQAAKLRSQLAKKDHDSVRKSLKKLLKEAGLLDVTLRELLG